MSLVITSISSELLAAFKKAANDAALSLINDMQIYPNPLSKENIAKNFAEKFANSAANDVASAIDKYIKTGTVNVNVVTAGSASAQTGTGTGTIS